MPLKSDLLTGMIEQAAIDFDCGNPPGTVGLPQAITLSQAISLNRIAAALERIADAAEKVEITATPAPSAPA